MKRKFNSDDPLLKLSSVVVRDMIAFLDMIPPTVEIGVNPASGRQWISWFLAYYLNEKEKDASSRKSR